jgi:hypothetical protein
MDRENEAPLTEPLIVPVLFISGMMVEADGAVARLTGWETAPIGEANERRVVVRVAMTVEAARALHTDLGEALAETADGAGDGK